MEITESEDFLPGRLGDIKIGRDNHLLVSDHGSISIVQFDAEGNYLGRVANEGGGPGELSNFFSIIDNLSDTLLVRQQSGQLIWYAPNNERLYEHVKSVTPNSGDRRISVNGELESGLYLASENLVIRNVEQYSKEESNFDYNLFLTVDSDLKIVQDSLYSLKRRKPLIMMVGGGFRVHIVPNLYSDKVLPYTDGKYILAQQDSSFFGVYDANHQLVQKVPFNIKKRNLTSEEIDNLAAGFDDGEERKQVMEKVPSLKAPYQNLWVTENRIWLRINETVENKEFLIIDFEGNLLGRFTLPSEDSLKAIHGNTFYTVHSSDINGDSIRRYSVDL